MGQPRRTSSFPNTKTSSKTSTPTPASPMTTHSHAPQAPTSSASHAGGNASGSGAGAGGSGVQRNRNGMQRRTTGTGIGAGSGAGAAAAAVEKPFVPPPLNVQVSDAKSVSNGPHAHEGIEGIDFPTLPLSALHSYRYAYRLSCPAASKPFAQTILTQPYAAGCVSRAGIRKRVNKEVLAREVRKNFNAMGCSESDVIVKFLYTAGIGDKRFRLRFKERG